MFPTFYSIPVAFRSLFIVPVIMQLLLNITVLTPKQIVLGYLKHNILDKYLVLELYLWS